MRNMIEGTLLMAVKIAKKRRLRRIGRMEGMVR